MRWLVFLLLLVHAPIACTVWKAYRLAAALDQQTELRESELPFGVAQGQILDYAPEDLPQVLRLAGEEETQFLVYPTRNEAGGAAAVPDEPEPPLEYALRWLPSALSQGRQNAASAPPQGTPIAAWAPLVQFSRDNSSEGRLSWIVVDPSQALEAAGPWTWVEQFYLSWTYPRLRLFLAPSNLSEQLKRWQDAQAVRRIKASAVASCGQILLRNCIRHVTTFVQFGGSQQDEKGVIEALGAGATYVVFRELGKGSWFSFHALHKGRAYRMGSRVPEGSELVLQSAVQVRFSLFRSGQLLEELEGFRFSFTADQPGAYRLLVYRPELPVPSSRPWIVSSPIFVGAE